ncbi:MAG: hypothetical protein JO257_08370, partial [Deltaproteobacteria bacterium]|nr:hypothetical protein [Deltaproteobacteria bacterium]
MGLTADQIERRKAYVGLTPEDLRSVAVVKRTVQDTVDQHVEAFFSWLAKLPEAHGLTANREAMA